MASSSGTSSGLIGRLPNSSTDEDQKKRKRMISNRDSARRSRMKKQNHLDELLAEASRLKNENNQILMNVNMTNELFMKVEGENSVLQAQVNELTHRLQSLNDIIINNCLNVTSGNVDQMRNMINPTVINDDQIMMNNFGDHFMNPFDDWMYFNQPMIGSDLIMY